MDNYGIEELCQYLEKYEYFVIDEKVFYIYQDDFEDIEEKNIFLLKDPEADKNLKKIEQAAVEFTNKGIKRTDKIVAIGGGATTDFAGYLASVLLRGLEWVCIPTTVLGLVDASVGGKTAVNLENGKNLIGTFHPPVERLVCLDFLATLPDSEQVSGFCEILKYAFLDQKIYDYVQTEFNNLELFNLCFEYKKELVAKDMQDKGVRKLLNLGHTLGHAIEKSVDVKHGEAVAMGIEMKLKLFAPHLLETLESLKQKLRIDFPWPSEIPRDSFEKLILKDKKRESEKLDLILVEDIAKVKIESMNASELFEKLYHKDMYGSYFK